MATGVVPSLHNLLKSRVNSSLGTHDVANTESGSARGERRAAQVGTEVTRSGVGFGVALAIAISWSKNGSILSATPHGVLYVIYHAVTR